jgi:hypothetical protein
MWVVAKININNLNIFKKNITEKIGKDIKFYQPKFEYHKYFGNKVKKYEKYILDNYIFCYHEKFNKSYFINGIKFLKGLKYFLDGHDQNQNQIINFIEYCKSFENEKGNLTQSFFKAMIGKKAKFLSGPFTNMVFKIIEKQKNKLKIIVGDVVTTISDKNNYLYRPI